MHGRGPSKSFSWTAHSTAGIPNPSIVETCHDDTHSGQNAALLGAVQVVCMPASCLRCKRIRAELAASTRRRVATTRMALRAVSASAAVKYLRPFNSLVVPQVFLGHCEQQPSRRPRQIAVRSQAPKKKTPFPITGDLELPHLDTNFMADKRKAEASASGGRKGGRPGPLVNPQRMRVLKDGKARKGPILYWYEPTMIKDS